MNLPPNPTLNEQPATEASHEYHVETSAMVFPIVGIGASAGGIDAVSSFISHLPADTGMAFVVVQHLDRAHESRLRDIYAKCTTMDVIDVQSGVSVQPNTVYVIPANTTITLQGRTLELKTRSEHGVPMPIDKFFKSIAECNLLKPIGVILSGTGSDGTIGLEEIKAAGGITFA